MWNSGNLGDRRPRATLRAKGGDPSGFAYEGALAAVLTGTIDVQDLDGDGQVDGFDSGRPGLQSRIRGSLGIGQSINAPDGELLRFDLGMQVDF